MSICGIHAPISSKMIDALGWNSRNFDLKDVENRYILLNNLANIAGYILSPLIGLIRIVVNTYFLILNEDESEDEWTKEEAGFLKAQIARGVCELIGGGCLLWIPDLVVTINRHCISKDESYSEHWN